MNLKKFHARNKPPKRLDQGCLIDPLPELHLKSDTTTSGNGRPSLPGSAPGAPRAVLIGVLKGGVVTPARVLRDGLTAPVTAIIAEDKARYTLH